jgi:benzoate transport
MDRIAHPLQEMERAPMSRAQIVALSILCSISMLDGYDVLAITFAAPHIAVDWQLGKGVLGIILSSGLIGMAAGSLLLAPFADVLGRRRMVLVNLCLMGIGMFLSAFSQNVAQLVALRFITGIGIGAMVPIVTPLAAEYSNNRWRALAIAIMALGFPLGGMIGGLAGAALLACYDWHAIFLLGAGLALIMWPVVLFGLHEPLAILLNDRGGGALDRVNQLLRRYGLVPIQCMPATELPTQAAPYRAIFEPGQRRATILALLVNALFVMCTYYMLSWMPQLITDQGYPASKASLLTALSSSSGIVASLAVGLVGAHLSPRVIVPALMIGLGLATIAFGAAAHSLPVMFTMVIIIGCFMYGGIVALYTLLIAVFAPHMRATGVGFVLGIGRAAGAIAPALAGWLFAIGASRSLVSILMAILAALAGAIVIAWHPKRASPGR